MIPEEKILRGIPVSPGIAVGRAYLCASLGSIRTQAKEINPDEVELEVERFLRAVELSRQQIAALREKMAQALDEKHAEIYTPQLAVLEDVELIDATVELIRAEKKNAEYLFARRINEYLAMLRQLDNEYFSGREADLRDVALRVLRNLNEQAVSVHSAFAPDTILVGTDLLPSQTENLLREHVIGLALEKGGPTSHTAIIAKATEIPAVVGVEGIMDVVKEGAPLIVDGISGKVIVFPTDETFRAYARKQAEFDALERELEEIRELPSETLEGYSVVLRANIEFPDEVSHVKLHGAQGVGLFRTEFLFLNRSDLPSEEEQYRVYKEVAERVYPHPVTFRTLDVGGDKFFGASSRPQELNPFMGLRAVRLCLKHPEIFRPQLRAILRANSLGNAKILFPMISGVDELRRVKAILAEVMEELRQEGYQGCNNIEIGAMVEIPSAAILADELAAECDFFSIGTNDLIQYTLAVDRGNRSVAYLYQPLHLAVLRLIKNIVKAAEDAAIRVSVCGEAAADPLYALLLVGLGVHELSMSAVNVPAVKRAIRAVTLKETRELVEAALSESGIERRKIVLREFMERLIREGRLPAEEMLTLSASYLD